MFLYGAKTLRGASKVALYADTPSQHKHTPCCNFAGRISLHLSCMGIELTASNVSDACPTDDAGETSVKASSLGATTQRLFLQAPRLIGTQQKIMALHVQPDLVNHPATVLCCAGAYSAESTLLS